MDEYAEERNRIFIDFVKTGDAAAARKAFRKLGVRCPRGNQILAAGIYKAVQYCTNIPEDVKTTAMKKCLEMGFNPFIRPYDYDRGD